jgi:hypothetical protein
MQFPVGRACLEKLVVGSRSFNLPIGEYHDHIRVENGGQTMRDNGEGRKKLSPEQNKIR